MNGYDFIWSGLSSNPRLPVVRLVLSPRSGGISVFSMCAFRPPKTLQKLRSSPLRSFLQPFQWELWVSLATCVFAIGIAMFLLDRHSPFDRYPVNTVNISEDDEDEQPLGLAGALWFVWGVLLDSGIGERSPRGMAARVVGMTWCAFSAIMVASYTANLAAFLVLDQPVASLTGISDTRLRNPSANFTFATVKHSNTHEYFKRHIELQTMARMMENRNYPTANSAIADVKTGVLDAFIWDSTYLDFEAAKDCSLGISGSTFGGSAYGIALQKNSPWTRLFSLAVLHLIENGTIEDLENRWIFEMNSHPCILSDNTPARLGLMNMKDLFILVAAGIGFGTLLSLFERRVRIWKIRRAGGSNANITTSVSKTMTCNNNNSNNNNHRQHGMACAGTQVCSKPKSGDQSDVWLMPPSIRCMNMSSNNPNGRSNDTKYLTNFDKMSIKSDKCRRDWHHDREAHPENVPMLKPQRPTCIEYQLHDPNLHHPHHHSIIDIPTQQNTCFSSPVAGTAIAPRTPTVSLPGARHQPTALPPPNYSDVVENGNMRLNKVKRTRSARLAMRPGSDGSETAEAGFSAEFALRAPTTTAVMRMSQLSPGKHQLITDPSQSPMFYKKPVALI